MEREISFCELRRREVINGSDGRRLGHIVDMLFEVGDGKISGVILPYGKRGVFAKSQELFVPWRCVKKIGEDVILVEINELASGMPVCVPTDKPECLPAPKQGKGRSCDGKCEKCMLFDCTDRWDVI